jgi:2-keto-3-deoxy-L-rhamnonate aldolase RhmA
MSLLTEAIAKSGSLIGTLITIPSSALSEALSLSGLDWLLFDLEHSVMTLGDVQSMIQAMHASCLPFIRIEEPSTVYVKKALDTGCAGVIVPQVNSVVVARDIVKAGKFPPFGARSVGLGRALGYGATLTDGVKAENSRASIIVQIEHALAVEAVEEILALDGLDGVFIGPYDLSGSYGVPGDIKDPRVQEAIRRVVVAAQKAGKPAGIFAGTAEGARQECDKGFQFITVGSDLSRLVVATQAMCLEAKAKNR